MADMEVVIENREFITMIGILLMNMAMVDMVALTETREFITAIGTMPLMNMFMVDMASEVARNHHWEIKRCGADWDLHRGIHLETLSTGDEQSIFK